MITCMKSATIVAALFALSLMGACSPEEQAPRPAQFSGESSAQKAQPATEEADDEVAVPRVTSVKISPEEASSGMDLQATVQYSDDTLPVKSVYAWFVNGEHYWFADDSVLPAEAFVRGDTVRVEVTPRLDLVDGTTVVSEELTILNAVPRIDSDPKDAVMDASAYTYQVVASDADGDPLTFSLQQSPQGMSVDADTGLVSWDLAQASEGEVKFRIGVRDDFEGETLQAVRLKLGTVVQGGGQ